MDLAGTWNTSGTPTLIKANVTDTASNAASLLMDLQTNTGGAPTSRFSVSKGGNVTFGSTGSSTAPSLNQSAELSLYGGTNISLTNSLGNRGVLLSGNSTLALHNAMALGFSGGNGVSDLYVTRDTLNVLAQRNGVNAQNFRVYNTFTDASNYERLNSYWSGNVAYVQTTAAGTGTLRPLAIVAGTDLQLWSGGTQRWNLQSANGHLLAQTDNTVDIGAVGATRPRNAYLAGQIFLGALGEVTQDYLKTGRLEIRDGVTAPAATVGQAKIYVDTADGDLKVIFGDGTIKTIVTDT
jgi:hypothetical protein